jgi:phage terminase large subunit-like protein
MKSALVAYRVAWEITRNPAVRVLYISSTSTLATKQLKFIKDILTCDRYRRYWPEMVHPEEGKREKWTETEISVDHPLRKTEAVRDPTVFTAGLTTGITGLHCDIAVLDDVVVRENAITKEGRSKVEDQYSLLSSIETTDAREWVVGTRYHPTDLYHQLQEMVVEEYDETGDLLYSEPLYEVFERAVEDRGDGTGEYLWPRQRRNDGKAFGFNSAILAKKRTQYMDKSQFRAQYYNDPNDPDSAPLESKHFNYYDRAHLSQNNGHWYFRGERLNVFAAIDFAYTTKRTSDYTAIVVVGVDAYQNYYVLDIDRFRTSHIDEYFKHILTLHTKWNFRKIRAEVTAAQSVIVKDLKQNYIQKFGLAISVDDYTPPQKLGSKEERVANILHSRYRNGQVWHYRGGHCQILEDELVVAKPAHDDIKDALASAVDVCVPPSRMASQFRKAKDIMETGRFNTRFGGVA